MGGHKTARAHDGGPHHLVTACKNALKARRQHPNCTIMSQEKYGFSLMFEKVANVG
jgi:hypothetical protein